MGLSNIYHTKKDMTVRTISDFRELNKQIIRQPFPILTVLSSFSSTKLIMESRNWHASLFLLREHRVLPLRCSPSSLRLIHQVSYKLTTEENFQIMPMIMLGVDWCLKTSSLTLLSKNWRTYGLNARWSMAHQDIPSQAEVWKEWIRLFRGNWVGGWKQTSQTTGQLGAR